MTKSNPRKNRKAKKEMDLGKLFQELDELNYKFATDSENITNKDTKRYLHIRRKLVKTLSPLLNTVARLGLMTAFCWDKTDAVAGFGVDYISTQDGVSFDLNCTDVVYVSKPAPKYELMEDSPRLDPMTSGKIDKNSLN